MHEDTLSFENLKFKFCRSEKIAKIVGNEKCVLQKTRATKKVKIMYKNIV